MHILQITLVTIIIFRYFGRWYFSACLSGSFFMSALVIEKSDSHYLLMPQRN